MKCRMFAMLLAVLAAATPALAGGTGGGFGAKLRALRENSWVFLGLGMKGGAEVPAVFDEANGLFFKYGGCGDHSPRINIKGSKRPNETYGNSCWAVDINAGKWKMIRPRDMSFPANRPGNGCSRCYAYDSKRKLVWMYGGISNGGGGGNNWDLWTYDGKTDKFKQWHAKNPAKRRGDSAPGDVFVYDSAHDLLIMPWGKTTRVYDPRKNAWQDRATPGGPPAPRHYGNMVFEPVRKRVIYPTNMGTGKWQEGKKRPPAERGIFWAAGKRNVGGKTVRGFYEYVLSTWAYDVAGNKWRKLPIKKEEQPSPRWRFGITYDSRNQMVILVGGSNCTWDKDEEYYRDVWAFDPKTDKWTEMKPKGPAPQVRGRECRHCAYDEKNNVVLFLTHRAGLWAYRYKNAALKKEATK